MDFIKRNAKSVVTFVLGIILQAVNDLLSGRVPVESWQDAVKYIGTSLVAAGVVWLTGNKLDLGQILRGTQKLETSEQVEVAKGALAELPDHVSDNVVEGYPQWGRHAKGGA